MALAPLQSFADGTLSAGLLAAAVVLVTVVQSLEFVDGYETRALTVLGEYRGLLEPGVHLVPPFVSGTRSFDMRAQSLDVASATEGASATVSFTIEDAETAFLAADDYRASLEAAAREGFERAVGDRTPDQLRAERDRLADRLADELGEAADEWGVRIDGVEIRIDD
ncbi:SPFH domain-containing protein [Halorussus marinus]|uniref:SPFH domain-containing protein n=1 Tax=Halorussus marinus TaxID=2505976 RepID=UPI0010932E99|nr:SPFH domain-containing protein [Halorussus marinus]